MVITETPEPAVQAKNSAGSAARATGTANSAPIDALTAAGSIGSAAGAAGVVLVGAAADPFDPVAVKASMGALFAVPVARAADAAEFFAWAAGAGVSVVTTSAKAERSFWAPGYPRPLALLLGAEGAGLPDDVLRAGDVQVRIPMTGTAESLNLAVAAGLLLYQARKPDLTG